jgi:predicted GIY-YIG superfamily endonuclease
LCDEKKDLEEELGFLKDQFISNGYPVQTVEDTINSYKPREEVANLDGDNGGDKDKEEKDKWADLCIQYVPRFSDKFKKTMEKEGISVVFAKPKKTIKTEVCKLYPPKIKGQEKDLVYKVDCRLCSSSYIGETSQNLGKRLLQHKRGIIKGDSQNPFHHHLRTSHHYALRRRDKGISAFHWGETQILEYQGNRRERKISEALFIRKMKKDTPMMNLDNGVAFDLRWDLLLDRIPTKITRRISERSGTKRRG